MREEAVSPEPNKRHGLCYAVTNEGLELPVIDVTHPAFAVQAAPAEIEAAIEQWVRAVKGGLQMPPEAMQAAVARSVLMRGTLAASGAFMSGMTTYLLKLGPDNLGDYASEMDRAIAGNVVALSLRLRLPHVARLVAGGLSAGLSARTGPIHLVNIAGGTAIDSLNALLLLRGQHPRELAGRRVVIHVLESDRNGPDFAVRALAALAAPGAPLVGIDAVIERIDYDWRTVSTLRDVLESIDGPDVVSGGSSEGGLFEYGSDDQILENLGALRDRTPDHFVVVGSLLHDLDTIDPRLAFMDAVPGRPAFRFLGRKGLETLAARAGWSLACCFDTPVHQVVQLNKR